MIEALGTTRLALPRQAETLGRTALGATLRNARRVALVVSPVLACVGCGGVAQVAPASEVPAASNDNVPPAAAPRVASTSVLDPDAPFFLRLNVEALRASPVADTLRDGQRRGGLFRSIAPGAFDPVDGLDAVASMASPARISPRGVLGAWRVVGLLRPQLAPHAAVEAALLAGDGSAWVGRDGYAAAPVRPPWDGYTAFVGASREAIVLRTHEEGGAQPALVEQLRDVASPIDRALFFEPGKLGEIRLAMSGLPMGIASVHLSGRTVEADQGLSAGVVLDGEIEPLPTRASATLHAELESLLHRPTTAALARGFGLAGILSRTVLRDTSHHVQVTARLEWAEVGRIVTLITDLTTSGQRPPSATEPPVVVPVPPPPQP